MEFLHRWNVYSLYFTLLTAVSGKLQITDEIYTTEIVRYLEVYVKNSFCYAYAYNISLEPFEIVLIIVCNIYRYIILWNQ